MLYSQLPSVCLGNWKTAFQPERTSLQEFHVDDNTTVMVPMMTHTGPYFYFNDKVRRSHLPWREASSLCDTRKQPLAKVPCVFSRDADTLLAVVLLFVSGASK